jgi:hypothetical protein
MNDNNWTKKKGTKFQVSTKSVIGLKETYVKFA